MNACMNILTRLCVATTLAAGACPLLQASESGEIGAGGTILTVTAQIEPVRPPEIPGFWIGTHPHWTNGMVFSSEGHRFHRDGHGDGGTWSFDPATMSLTLMWDAWPHDTLTWDGHGFSAPGFRIDPPTQTTPPDPTPIDPAPTVGTQPTSTRVMGSDPSF
ncbi:MAG: hypothetical protein RLZZ127_1650 [Planctomycetota bacterium]|jgi:hypothetical protein